jgi:hypothetical protein
LANQLSRFTTGLQSTAAAKRTTRARPNTFNKHYNIKELTGVLTPADIDYPGGGLSKITL